MEVREFRNLREAYAEELLKEKRFNILCAIKKGGAFRIYERCREW